MLRAPCWNRSPRAATAERPACASRARSHLRSDPYGGRGKRNDPGNAEVIWAMSVLPSPGRKKPPRRPGGRTARPRTRRRVTQSGAESTKNRSRTIRCLMIVLRPCGPSLNVRAGADEHATILRDISTSCVGRETRSCCGSVGLLLQMTDTRVPRRRRETVCEQREGSPLVLPWRPHVGVVRRAVLMSSNAALHDRERSGQSPFPSVFRGDSIHPQPDLRSVDRKP